MLDLFSGIGGFSLGLERTGMRTVAFCEIEDYPRKVLAKHWPDVPCYQDIRELTARRLEDDGITGIDLICGGFPCQDISLAGKGAGINGERSGLWKEYARIIGEVGPRWVIIENVPALRSRGLVTVLQDLCSLGYDAEWHCIPASDPRIGAPHHRDRIWIVGYPRRPDARRDHAREGEGDRVGVAEHVMVRQRRSEEADGLDPSGHDVADADSEGLPILLRQELEGVQRAKEESQRSESMFTRNGPSSTT